MRLFTGISLPAPIVDAIAATIARLKPSAPIRWSPAANLHITTKFIGEWPDDRLDSLTAALAAVQAPPMSIHINGLGWFPTPHSPRIFWVAVRAGEALPALARGTESALEAIGVPAENREYRPHLTLARIDQRGHPVDLAPLRRAVATLDSADFGAFDAREFHLYRSQPGPSGSVYTVLQSFPLTL